MTGEIINLRQARKRKARSEREKTAEDNRIRFGRTKAEKQLTQKTEDLAERRLDAHRRVPGLMQEPKPARPETSGDE
ncbi:DUF4169 family protein [Roseibium sp.]|uniref:DUF4169 family protein n=1 Tax=Roseibium sp. TaxID=1936156 RepID=UPI003A96E20E